MDGKKCSISIVAKDRRRSVFCAQHDIEIAVGFDVNRPSPGIRRIGHRLRQFGLRGHIRESSGTILPKQAHSACPSQHQVGLEIVVEVDGDNALGRGATPDGPPGNGNVAPVDRRTSRPFATAVTGVPALASGMAPIQLQRPVPKFVSG